MYPQMPPGHLAPRQATWCIGGITITVGCSEGKPIWPTEVFGNALELPADLARDELKKTLIMDWLRDMAEACLEEAKVSMGFRGIPGRPELAVQSMGNFLAGSAEKTIKGIGL